MPYRGTRIVKVELAAESESETGVLEALDESEEAMADALSGIDATIFDSGSTVVEEIAEEETP